MHSCVFSTEKNLKKKKLCNLTNAKNVLVVGFIFGYNMKSISKFSCLDLPKSLQKKVYFVRVIYRRFC